MGKCVFNRSWCSKYKWVRETADKYKVLCIACRKEIDIGTMGESGLKSHGKSIKHCKNEKDLPAMNLDFFSVKKEVSHTVTEPPSESCVRKYDFDLNNGMTIPPPPPCTKAANNTSGTGPKQENFNVQNFVTKNDVLQSEILWTLQTVVMHNSYKSNENMGDVFRRMFPDSSLANKFSCGERKTSYLSVFGIAEHFKQLTLSSVKGFFVILFDESLNKKMQEKQMDIRVRYWDTETNEVVTRYLGSQFLGQATAYDMVKHFKEAIVDKLNVSDLIQISMDGPNVNWAFYNTIKEQINTDYCHDLINIGSCGLHTVHNAFKSGAQATEWDLSSILSSLYYLFKDSPARREDYMKNATHLPLKFVDHRWLENVPVSQRALKIWDSVEVYIKKTQTKEFTKPTNKSYQVLCVAVKDKLIKAKLEFFCSIANILQPFLINFQTDRPMVTSELTFVIKSLMSKVIKSDVLQQATTTEKLVKIDPDEKDNYLTYKMVDIGFQAEEKLKLATTTSEKEVMEFRIQCRTFILGVLKKILLKSPIIYSLVRNMAALDPREMERDADLCRSKFKMLIKLIMSTKRINDCDAEAIMLQYNVFLDKIPDIGSVKFSGFDPYKNRLDEFAVSYMSEPRLEKLLAIVKLLLTLSHGQATVERGFSVNKELECVNLRQQSLVAQRIICKHVKKVGGVLEVKMTNQLLVSAASARQKYNSYLEQEREKNKSDAQQRKRKLVLEEIDDLKKKKKQAKLDQEALEKKADELSVKAEKTFKWEVLAQANASRKGSKEKMKIYEDLSKHLDDKLDELKKN